MQEFEYAACLCDHDRAGLLPCTLSLDDVADYSLRSISTESCAAGGSLLLQRMRPQVRRSALIEAGMRSHTHADELVFARIHEDR